MADANVLYSAWFPRRVGAITIVAPPADESLVDADPTSPNYALMDRLGDRDAVYSVGTLLARKFPQAVVSLISSDDFEHYPLTGNLVIVGGPGQYVGDEWEFGNSAHRIFVEKLGSNIGYTDDAEGMRVGGNEYRARTDRRGRLIEDWGAFASFQNPYRRASRIVMLHGVHTLGVVGATKVFDGSSDSLDNLTTLGDWLASSGCASGFEAFFSVDILHGTVACPDLSPDQIFCLGGPRTERPAANRRGGGAEHEKDQILATVQVAMQTTIQSNRGRLSELLADLSQATLTSDQLTRIGEICASNPLLPRDLVDEIRGVMEGR